LRHATGKSIDIVELSDFRTGAKLSPEQAYIVRDSDENPCLKPEPAVNPDTTKAQDDDLVLKVSPPKQCRPLVLHSFTLPESTQRVCDRSSFTAVSNFAQITAAKAGYHT
jgi:hypothetical protein